MPAATRFSRHAGKEAPAATLLQPPQAQSRSSNLILESQEATQPYSAVLPILESMAVVLFVLRLTTLRTAVRSGTKIISTIRAQAPRPSPPSTHATDCSDEQRRCASTGQSKQNPIRQHHESRGSCIKSQCHVKDMHTQPAAGVHSICRLVEGEAPRQSLKFPAGAWSCRRRTRTTQMHIYSALSRLQIPIVTMLRLKAEGVDTPVALDPQKEDSRDTDQQHAGRDHR